MKKLITFLSLSLLAHTFSITAMESYPGLEVRETRQVIIDKEEFFKANTTYKVILYSRDYYDTDIKQGIKKISSPNIAVASRKFEQDGWYTNYAIEIHFKPTQDISKKALETQLAAVLFFDSLEVGNDAYSRYQKLNWPLF